MTAGTLREQLTLAHKVLEDTVSGINEEQAHWQPGGQAHSIAANYAHIVVQEDVIVNVLLKGGDPLFATTFAGKTGLSDIPPLPSTELVKWQEWGEQLRLDLETVAAYSQAVYNSTEAYLDTVTDDVLLQNIDTGFLGEMSKFELLNLTVLTNCNWHTGEISAVKGLQGLKGYPF